MSTLISTFREPVRVLIGDNDADGIYLREDTQIDAALRFVLDLGKVLGDDGTTVYAVDSLRTSVTPTLSAADDPGAFARLVYNAAKQFRVDSASPTAWRTRAFSEVIGENREAVFSIMEELYRLDYGDGAASSDYAAE